MDSRSTAPFRLTSFERLYALHGSQVPGPHGAVRGGSEEGGGGGGAQEADGLDGRLVAHQVARVGEGGAIVGVYFGFVVGKCGCGGMMKWK